jgi:type I site-specific restriction endonuclease
MITVRFPDPQFRIRRKGETPYIFDAIRKSWLVLTEEEWVRQNVVAYFIQTLAYPKEAIALEKEILVNGLKKRFDILVYNKFHEPWMLVECKAPNISLNETVLQQALRYNLSVPVFYLVISNGSQTMVWKKKAASLELLQAFPAWLE